MHVMDTLNKRMGRRTLYQAPTGIKRDWGLRAEYRSPSYTLIVISNNKIARTSPAFARAFNKKP
mgnify:FL=1